MAAEASEQPPRKIVVAVDEGEESMYALSWCLKNVIGVGDGTSPADIVVLLYAMPHRAVYVPMDGTGYLFSEEIVESMDKYSKDVADSVIQRAKEVCSAAGLEGRGVKVETMVRKGDARDVVSETVEKAGADLLVLGSHGYGIIKRAFLGSVSNHCAQNAKCPVLIVKRPNQH